MSAISTTLLFAARCCLWTGFMILCSASSSPASCKHKRMWHWQLHLSHSAHVLRVWPTNHVAFQSHNEVIRGTETDFPCTVVNCHANVPDTTRVQLKVANWCWQVLRTVCIRKRDIVPVVLVFRSLTWMVESGFTANTLHHPSALHVIR